MSPSTTSATTRSTAATAPDPAPTPDAWTGRRGLLLRERVLRQVRMAVMDAVAVVLSLSKSEIGSYDEAFANDP